MSSILEALKKLEEDKAARRGGIGNIAGRVTSTPRRSRMLPAWVWPSAMAAVALCAVLVTFTLMGGFTKPSSSPPRPAQPAAGAVAVPQLAATPDSAAPPQPTFPQTETGAEQQSRSPAPAAPAQKPALRPSPNNPAPAPVQQDSHVQGIQAPAPVKPAVEIPMPVFNVTGIAWQMDEASRLAIVNGTSVSEGSKVEGALVEEIFPDRVRLSFQGKILDIALDKNSR